MEPTRRKTKKLKESPQKSEKSGKVLQQSPNGAPNCNTKSTKILVSGLLLGHTGVMSEAGVAKTN